MKLTLLICFLAVYQFTATTFPIPYSPSEEIFKNKLDTLRIGYVKFSIPEEEKYKAEEPEIGLQLSDYHSEKEDEDYIVGHERRKLVRCKYGYDALGNCLKLEDIYFY
ncbi:hypothetical protein Trydic_g17714 [Trypoxylus dichotomus]